MKSSISHVFAFVLMLTIFFFIAFISFEVSVSNKVLLFNLDRINYYEYAYGSINKNIKEYVVNDDLLNALGEEFKNYYESNVEYDDANRTIKLSVNVKDYEKAMKIVNKYNKEHTNSSFEINIYATYDETEINMKSDGYTCK